MRVNHTHGKEMVTLMLAEKRRNSLQVSSSFRQKLIFCLLLVVILYLTQLKRLGGEVEFRLVLASNVTPHGVVPRERARAVRTRSTDTLMSLTNVSTEVSLVAIEPLTVRALELLT